MIHKIFKVLDSYYIHIDDQTKLCPLADFISCYKTHSPIEVIEVRYIPQARQGVVVVNCEQNNAEEMLEELVTRFIQTYGK